VRLAAIDIGTNSTLLAVADAAEGGLRPVVERCEVTRLGRGVSSAGVISRTGLDATLAAVEAYLAECGRLGVERVRATGTSAMRDAANASEARAAFAALGLKVEVISGEREARLTYLSAIRDFGAVSPRLAVIDVGGGSTEVIIGEGGSIAWHRSFDVGVVRGKETWMPSDPPTDDEVRRAEAETEKTFTEIPECPGCTAVAVAGTPTTLAAVRKRLEVYSRSAVHGTVLSLADLRGLRDMLVRMPLVERVRLPGIEPKRADVLDTGAIILIKALERLGVEAVTVSDGGVRWGLLWEMAGEGESRG
jgi:exopolyphosphatase / guanosine-5'-triphosphate,3'-diphosphate pyrophosphatase